ncbi:MAG: hypothetical protein AAF940_09130 [Pseudomonadota bacterium]
MSKILAVRLARIKTQIAICGGLVASIILAVMSVPRAMAAPISHAEVLNLATMLAAPASQSVLSQTSAMLLMAGALIAMLLTAFVLGKSLSSNITAAGRGRI